jgi:hypothetical protein
MRHIGTMTRVGSNAGHGLGKFDIGAFAGFITLAMDLFATHNGILAPIDASAIQISSAIRVVFHKQLVRHIHVIDRYETSGGRRKTKKKKKCER